MREIECTMFSEKGFYIGDPCYVLNRDDYDRCCCRDGVFKCRRGSYCAYSTAYGDGDYEGSDGVEYYVDSGMIGVVAGELVNEEEWGEVTREHSRYIPCEGQMMRAIVGVEDGVFRILITDISENWSYLKDTLIKIDTNEMIIEEE